LVACATPAVKQASAPAPTGGGAGDIQCHIESVTGSMLKNRVCMTKAQREAQQALTDQMKDALQYDRNSGCPNGNPPPCGK
jgi:hypothetical protein